MIQKQYKDIYTQHHQNKYKFGIWIPDLLHAKCCGNAGSWPMSLSYGCLSLFIFFHLSLCWNFLNTLLAKSTNANNQTNLGYTKWPYIHIIQSFYHSMFCNQSIFFHFCQFVLLVVAVSVLFCFFFFFLCVYSLNNCDPLVICWWFCLPPVPCSSVFASH